MRAKIMNQSLAAALVLAGGADTRRALIQRPPPLARAHGDRPRAGELREPPPTGSATYPVLGEAPGSYVRS